MAEAGVVSPFTLTTSIAVAFAQAASSTGSYLLHISNISGAARLYTLYLRADATGATSADAITGLSTSLPVSASQLLPVTIPGGGTLQGVADVGSGVVVMTNGITLT